MLNNMPKYLSILLISLLSISCNATEILSGKVIKVSDGDTINILVNNKKHRIRFAEIDCPEKKQPWGKKAKTSLAEYIAGKNVQVEKITIDRYKRIIGKVFYDGENINRKMVSNGHCWVYRKYMKDRSLLELEQDAKDNRRGLWQLPEHERIPPWEYRKIQRDKRKKK